MPGMIWTNLGIEAYEGAGGGFVNSAKKWGLFTNNYTPLVTTVLADLTEPSNTGYARLGSAGWSHYSSSGGVSAGTQGTETWTFTANALSEIVYGWFLYGSTAGAPSAIFGAKRFAAPYLIPAAGSSFPLTFSSSLQRLP